MALIQQRAWDGTLGRRRRSANADRNKPSRSVDIARTCRLASARSDPLQVAAVFAAPKPSAPTPDDLCHPTAHAKSVARKRVKLRRAVRAGLGLPRWDSQSRSDRRGGAPGRRRGRRRAARHQLVLVQRQLAAHRLGLSQRRHFPTRATSAGRSTAPTCRSSRWPGAPMKTKSQYGSYSSSPIISNGVCFFEDLESNVQAVSLKTGKVIWTKTYEPPDQGPNGSSWLVGACMARRRRRLRARQKTGEQLWSVTLVRNEHEASTWRRATTTGSSTSPPCRATSQVLRGRRRRGLLGALKQRPARSCGTSTPCRKPVVIRTSRHQLGGGLWYAPSSTRTGTCTRQPPGPGAVSRDEPISVGLEQARPRPVHRLDREARRRHRAGWSGTTS